VNVGPQGPIQARKLELWVGLGHVEEVLRGQVGEDLQEKFVGEGQQPRLVYCVHVQGKNMYVSSS